MFVFQSSAQKQFVQQNVSVQVFTGAEAQQILRKGVAPVCEQMLSRVHGKQDAF